MNFLSYEFIRGENEINFDFKFMLAPIISTRICSRVTTIIRTTLVVLHHMRSRKTLTRNVTRPSTAKT